MGIRYQDIPVEIDENVLTKIADMTGGSYFRATDNRKLQAIYGEIDQMENEVESERVHEKERRIFPFLLAALLCLLAEVVLNNTILRRLP